MPYVSPHRPPHESFPQPEDSTVRVWRYLDLPRFIWLLSTGALAFARVDSLEDPFEGSIPPAVYEAWKSRNAELVAGPPDLVDRLTWSRMRGVPLY